MVGHSGTYNIEIHTDIDIHIRTYIHTYIHIYICIYMFIYSHTHFRTYIHIDIHKSQDTHTAGQTLIELYVLFQHLDGQFTQSTGAF